MAQIIEVNGEPVEFPDGMSDDQIAAAIQQNSAPQGAAPALTQEQQDQMLPVNKPTDMGLMPNGDKLPYGITPEMMAAQNQSNDQSNQQNAAMRQDPTMMQRVAQAKSSPWYENMAKSLGHVVNQFGSGAEDLIDQYLPNAIAQPLNYRPAGDMPYDSTAEQRMSARKEEMKTARDEDIARSIGDPVPSTIGSMAPYLVTGGAANRAIDLAAGAISPITKELALKGAGFVNPSFATHVKNSVSLPSDYMKRMGYAAKAPAIGAMEGSVNYDQTAGEGAAMSALGSLAGAVGPVSRLARVERNTDPGRLDIINRMYGSGMKLTPGLKIGNQAMQVEEAAIRNSGVFGDYYNNKIVRPNNMKLTEFAGDAMGLPSKGVESFTSKQLTDHLDDLSSQYKTLESSTTGVVGTTQAQKMADALNEFRSNGARNQHAEAKSNYKQIKDILTEMRGMGTPVTGSGPTVYAFDGAKYQAMRSRIQSEMNDAYGNNKTRLGDSLKKVRDAFDDSLQSGMDNGTVKQWKDLNERYAMTNFMLDNGLDATRSLDPRKLTSALMDSKEVKRTLLNQGGRIKNLQKIAEYNTMLGKVEGSGLTGGLGAYEDSAKTLSALPWRYRIKPYARAMAGIRLSSAPTWGFSPTAGMQVGRAAGQTEPADKAYEGAKMGVDQLLKMIKGDR